VPDSFMFLQRYPMLLRLSPMWPAWV